jgi:hypothetical protein
MLANTDFFSSKFKYLDGCDEHCKSKEVTIVYFYGLHHVEQTKEEEGIVSRYGCLRRNQNEGE